MLVEGAEIFGDVECDVCIVGAGAAGISIALELRNTAIDVALVESGGLEREADTQALYRGSQSGIPTDRLEGCRLRYFGGTTGHWGGWCRPLDEVDLEPRAWVAHSGWPFPRAELDRFYRRAHEICEIEEPDYDPVRWTSPEDRERGLLLSGEVWRNIVFQVSPPTRFGTRYLRDIESAAHITTYLRSNALDIRTDDVARRVTAIEFGTLSGERFRVRARCYVLATGAVENARILLSSNSVQPTGLGNTHDLVGRFFGQHPGYRKVLWAWAGKEFPRRVRRTAVRDNAEIATALSEQAVRDQEILNYHFLLHPYTRPEKNAGLLRGLYDRLWAEPGPEELEEAVGDLVQDVGRMSGGETVKPRFYIIEERPEQAPNPDSRVTLGDERDALGMRRVDVDWRLTELDLLTARRARELLIRELGSAGMGRVRGWPDDYEPAAEFLHGGLHHYGTTRMHDDPRQGVVDASCRVHGVDNLFVAGGSVFPTTGFANPTLTIVALAVRLAEEIRRRM